MAPKSAVSVGCISMCSLHGLCMHPDSYRPLLSASALSADTCPLGYNHNLLHPNFQTPGCWSWSPLLTWTQSGSSSSCLWLVPPWQPSHAHCSPEDTAPSLFPTLSGVFLDSSAPSTLKRHRAAPDSNPALPSQTAETQIAGKCGERLTRRPHPPH